MDFQPASAASLACFLAIVFAVAAGFVGAVHAAARHAGRPSRAWTLAVSTAGLAWLAIISALVAGGTFSRLAASQPAILALFFGLINAVSLGAALSPLGRIVARGIPVGVLLGFQGFRLPLELVLHSWAQQGTVPETMTWTGQNWDIVSGIVALIVAPFADRHRGLAWIGNLVGFLLLLNVMRVAMLSSPLPWGWNLERPLLLAFHFPYVLIAPVCVGGALFGHVALTRALLLPSERDPAAL